RYGNKFVAAKSASHRIVCPLPAGKRPIVAERMDLESIERMATKLHLPRSSDVDPLAMSSSKFNSRQTSAIVILVIGLMLSMAVSRLVRDWENLEIRNQVMQVAAESLQGLR